MTSRCYSPLSSPTVLGLIMLPAFRGEGHGRRVGGLSYQNERGVLESKLCIKSANDPDEATEVTHTVTRERCFIDTPPSVPEAE